MDGGSGGRTLPLKRVYRRRASLRVAWYEKQSAGVEVGATAGESVGGGAGPAGGAELNRSLISKKQVAIGLELSGAVASAVVGVGSAVVKTGVVTAGIVIGAGVIAGVNVLRAGSAVVEAVSLGAGRVANAVESAGGGQVCRGKRGASCVAATARVPFHTCPRGYRARGQVCTGSQSLFFATRPYFKPDWFSGNVVFFSPASGPRALLCRE